jgi:glycerol-3-phosphate dehydrogenase
MLRRTRLGLLAAAEVSDVDGAAARSVARVMGGELGWDDTRVEAELGAWRHEAEAEGIVLTEPARQ